MQFLLFLDLSLGQHWWFQEFSFLSLFKSCPGFLITKSFLKGECKCSCTGTGVRAPGHCYSCRILQWLQNNAKTSGFDRLVLSFLTDTFFKSLLGILETSQKPFWGHYINEVSNLENSHIAGGFNFLVARLTTGKSLFMGFFYVFSSFQLNCCPSSLNPWLNILRCLWWL